MKRVLQMKAIVLDQFGGPEVMRIGEVDKPEPDRGQVRIKVAATSVNRADTVQRRGHYPPPAGDSEILGLEVAGVVDGVGDGVGDWRAGDKVMGLVTGGGYAEYALAYQGHLMAMPESLTFQEAAAIPEVYVTAYLNLFMLGALKEGSTVLLHGGGGGVNTAAIQLCRTLLKKCRIIVTASTEKIEGVKQLGVDHAIDYKTQDFAREMNDLTDGIGAHVILDHIGASYLGKNIASLAVGGRLVVIGLMGGANTEINLGIMMIKRQSIIGSVLRSQPVSEKSAIISAFANQVLSHIRRRTIVPLIHRVYPLQEAAQAHQEMEASRHFGKIVLAVGQD